MSSFRDYIQPSIELLSIRVDEPVTTLTDLFLAFLCFYAYAKIRRIEVTSKTQWYLKYYFLTLGLGTLFGGLIGHAFLYRFAPYWKLVSWVFCLLSVALIAHAQVELARPHMRQGFRKLVVRLNLFALVLAVLFTIRMLEFSPVTYHSIYGLLVITGSFSFFIYQKTGSRGSFQFMIAVGLALVSAFVFSYRWGISPWFNHRDISHVILTGSAFYFYRGSTIILDPFTNS